MISRLRLCVSRTDGRTVRHILTSDRTFSLWHDEIDILVALVKNIDIIGVQEHCNYLLLTVAYFDISTCNIVSKNFENSV